MDQLPWAILPEGRRWRQTAAIQTTTPGGVVVQFLTIWEENLLANGLHARCRHASSASTTVSAEVAVTSAAHRMGDWNRPRFWLGHALGCHLPVRLFQQRAMQFRAKVRFRLNRIDLDRQFLGNLRQGGGLGRHSGSPP